MSSKKTSRKEYMAEYRKRKASGKFIDMRYDNQQPREDKCLNCNNILSRIRVGLPRKYCSNNNKCKNEYERKLAIDNGIAGIGSTKRYLIETRGYKCELCNNHSWMNKPISLELDHIDGNFNNNHLDNVRILCPNCHSQTSTYKIKNYGKGRSKKQYKSKPFYLSKSDRQIDTTT